MATKPKIEFRVNSPSTLPGCVTTDPTKVFNPIGSNDCLTCRKFSDYTCFDTAKLLDLPIPEYLQSNQRTPSP